LNKIKWIILIVLIGSFVGLAIYSNSSNAAIDVSKIDTNAIQTASADNGNIADHVYGNANAKVTLIEYGDFQCSGCGYEHPKIKVIIEKYAKQIRFVFRNYPLTTAHPNAMAAASAVEAAGLQGKYWEMHNKIYESQADWESLDGTERTDTFVAFAKSLGINTSKFTTDMASSSVSSKIAFDQALGIKIGISETPTFYLNGTKLSSDIWGDSTKLTAAIDADLTKAGVALPTTE
jgi:protein-disulfide isomerase